MGKIQNWLEFKDRLEKYSVIGCLVGGKVLMAITCVINVCVFVFKKM